MGCDIHSFVEEKQKDGSWRLLDRDWEVSFVDPWEESGQTVEPFAIRNYNVFAFLAGVRNPYGVRPISLPRDLPENASHGVLHAWEQWEGDGHNASWLTRPELIDFRYDNQLQSLSGETLKATTYRDFLDSFFFADLEVIRAFGNDRIIRIVFWFDN